MNTDQGNQVMDLIRSLQKWWFHLISGKSELERICENRMHDHLMAVRVARSLRLSRQLAAEAEGLFSNGSLPQLSGIHSSVRSIHRQICTVKRIGPLEAAEENAGLLASEIGSEITRDNLKLSLEMLFFVRVLKERAAARRALTMDRNIAEHEAALEGLWASLRPGVRRQGGKITEEWGEIGFQGKDPATDFRGMGILGLEQLNHLATTRSTQARDMLTLLSRPDCYVPLAATGINFTAFVIQLLEERLLDRRILAAVERTQLSSGRQGKQAAGEAEDAQPYAVFGDDDLLEAAMTELHEIYADYFLRFGEIWQRENPSTGIMAFPQIFNALKTQVRAELETAGAP